MSRKDKMERLDTATLHAFADGELEPEQAARIVMHLADCPADQQAVQQIMAMNALLARTCEAPLHEPVPPAIRAAIFGPPVAVSPPGTRKWARWVAGTGALAAALALAVVLLPRADGPALALGPVEPRSPMAEALDQLASGQSRLVARKTELGIIASFAVEGGYCREFSLRHDTGPDQAALACSAPDGWHVAARQGAQVSAPASGYVPAGGDNDDPIGAQLDARGAGLALTPLQEAQARGAGWR